MMNDPTGFFSDKVEQYVRYRPSYPAEVVELLVRECGLGAEAVVADVGSGPGNLARLFLERGLQVYGVEPNLEMREAGERLLADFAGFVSLAGTAEATGLPGASVDLVTAGQAFHWFDVKRARAEFRRILQPPHWVALVWNERRADASAFLAALDQVLAAYVTGDVWRRDAADVGTLRAFFGTGGHRVASFDNRQVFDYTGLCGRVMSSSYAPPPGDARHDELLRQLRELFDAHEREGTVTFEYDTKVYYGCL
jgi:SAM-dependent methyltransferase